MHIFQNQDLGIFGGHYSPPTEVTLLLPWTELGELLLCAFQVFTIPGLAFTSLIMESCVYLQAPFLPLCYEHLDTRNTLFPAITADPE